jgi:hypothetical protein
MYSGAHRILAHCTVRLTILNEGRSLCTNGIHREDGKGYTNISICTIYRDVVTVTKQGSSERVFPRLPILKHREGPGYATSRHPLSVGVCFGELSRCKTNTAVATV